jgi:ribosome maturation factor RimP
LRILNLNDGSNGALSGEGARLEALVDPIAQDMGFRLVRVRMVSGRPPRLQIMAERPDGSMSVEDCARLSRALSPQLDVEDPIHGEYVLEVSSPGLDRPLVRPEDFVRFAGQEAKVSLLRLLDGRKRFKGMLAGFEEDAVLIDDENGARFALPFALIDEAKLVLTDALIAASLKGQIPGMVPLADGSAVDLDDLDMKPARKMPGAQGKRERS